MWHFMKLPALGLAQLWRCCIAGILVRQANRSHGFRNMSSLRTKTYQCLFRMSLFKTRREVLSHGVRAMFNGTCPVDRTVTTFKGSLPAAVWHMMLMLTDKLSGRTSLAIANSWRLRQAGVTFVTHVHEGTLAFGGTLPQALDKAVAQLHEDDLELIQQRLVAALVQMGQGVSFRFVRKDSKCRAGPWGPAGVSLPTMFV